MFKRTPLVRTRVDMKVNTLKNWLVVEASEQTGEFTEMQWRSWTIILNFMSSGYLHVFSEKKKKRFSVVTIFWGSNNDSLGTRVLTILTWNLLSASMPSGGSGIVFWVGFFFLGRELFIPKGASAARSYCALGGGYMFRGGGQLGS